MYCRKIAFAAVVVAVTALGRRLPVPPPILQVAAGFLVGLAPGVTLPPLDPDLVFFVFLPPILWAAAFFTSLRDFSANRRPIGILAVGLVLWRPRRRGARRQPPSTTMRTPGTVSEVSAMLVASTTRRPSGPC